MNYYLSDGKLKEIIVYLEELWELKVERGDINPRLHMTMEILKELAGK